MWTSCLSQTQRAIECTDHIIHFPLTIKDLLIEYDYSKKCPMSKVNRGSIRLRTHHTYTVDWTKINNLRVWYIHWQASGINIVLLVRSLRSTVWCVKKGRETINYWLQIEINHLCNDAMESFALFYLRSISLRQPDELETIADNRTKFLFFNCSIEFYRLGMLETNRILCSSKKWIHSSFDVHQSNKNSVNVNGKIFVKSCSIQVCD